MPRYESPGNSDRRRNAYKPAAYSRDERGGSYGYSSEESRGPGAISWILFWPFHLFNLIARMAGPVGKWFLIVLFYPVIAALYAVVALAVIYGFRAQSYDLARLQSMPERSIILDRSGQEIGRLGGEKRVVVPLSQVSENFRKAIIAREDERFYKHGAFDVIGIVRATLNNLRGKREGASTITQQLASDIFELKLNEKRGAILRQIDRKCLEIAIGCRLESAFGKDEILEAYINQINWGRQIRGIGEASRIYFEKHPSELTLSQGALLAGIVRGPDSFNPFASMEAATRERNSTLARMVDAGSITRAQADLAKKEAIKVRPKDRRQTRASYAMDAIRRDLEEILDIQNIELNGLEITTTIDLRIQQKAEEALEKKLREVEKMPGYAHPTRAAWLKLPEDKRGDPSYLQGAIVVVHNGTGHVLAVVGGRDAGESFLNRAFKRGKHNNLDTSRQLGSIFKPFVYLAAFDRGLLPTSPISDGPIEPGEIKGAGNWRPHNSDGVFGGIEPASQGLIRSRNTMSVRVGNFAGLEKVADVARMAGFTTPMPQNPTSFLGSWGSLPWEVALAYTIFPNKGVRFQPILITQIKNRNGEVVYSKGTAPQRLAKSDSANKVSQILTEVTKRGTASAVKRLGFEYPCGGKTGTSNAFKDAWFAGYTSTLSCAVWTGFDTPQTIINKGFGSTIALPIWVDIMKTAHRLGYKAGQLSDVKIVDVALCRLSGKRATDGCFAADTAYTDHIPADVVPGSNDFCPIHPPRAVNPAHPEAPAAHPPAPPKPEPPPEPARALPVEDQPDIELPDQPQVRQPVRQPEVVRLPQVRQPEVRQPQAKPPQVRRPARAEPVEPERGEEISPPIEQPRRVSPQRAEPVEEEPSAPPPAVPVAPESPQRALPVEEE